MYEHMYSDDPIGDILSSELYLDSWIELTSEYQLTFLMDGHPYTGRVAFSKDKINYRFTLKAKWPSKHFEYTNHVVTLSRDEVQEKINSQFSQMEK